MGEHNELLDAVQKLARPYRTKVLQQNDAGISCITDIEHAPLLLQLRDAVIGGIGKHAGGSAARERIPFDAGALELFDEIAAVINGWYRRLPNAVEERHINDRLSDWFVDYENRRRGGKITLETDLDTTRLVEGWARRIEGMFDPEKTLEVTGACPTCGARYAFDPKSGDQMTAVVIKYRELGELFFDHATGMCRACTEVWKGGSRLRELRYLIDQAETMNEEDAA
jgi:hypothetical protein